MKVVSITVGFALLALIALTLVPAAGGYRSYVAFAALVAAAVLLVTIVVGWTGRPKPSVAGAEPVNVAPAPIAANQAEAEVVSFLATLQEKGRLVGKISGQAPFSGTLMHRGWKTESVKLPRMLRTGDDRFPTIAPAEVELK
jgi:ABC-type Fe3+-siderophore transport system permease subunit